MGLRFCYILKRWNRLIGFVIGSAEKTFSRVPSRVWLYSVVRCFPKEVEGRSRSPTHLSLSHLQRHCTWLLMRFELRQKRRECNFGNMVKLSHRSTRHLPPPSCSGSRLQTERQRRSVRRHRCCFGRLCGRFRHGSFAVLSILDPRRHRFVDRRRNSRRRRFVHHLFEHGCVGRTVTKSSDQFSLTL